MSGNGARRKGLENLSHDTAAVRSRQISTQTVVGLRRFVRVLDLME